MSEFVALFTTSTRTKGSKGSFGSFSVALFCSTLIIQLLTLNSYAQVPLHQHTNVATEKIFLESAIPFSYNRNTHFVFNDSLQYPSKSKRKTWFSRKLYDENFAEIHQNNFYIAVNPLINYQKMYSLDSSNTYYQNTRGIEIKFAFNNSISFQSVFYENQALFPEYIDEYMQKHLVAPGQGATKIFKINQHDFSQAQAVFYLRINPHLKLYFGHGKNFIGSGYRSLLLSDAAFSYPFLKINYTRKKWQYSVLWTEYNSFYYKYYARHYRKNGAIQLFSYAPSNFISLSFFQQTIFKTFNEQGRSYPWPLLLPAPIVQMGLYGFNNENNVLAGINTEISLKKYLKIYAQTAIDGLDKSQLAYQLGLFIPDITKNQIEKLQISLRAEYNQAFENIYDFEDSIQTYTHYNEALAHPLGNEFSELLIQCIADYRNIRFTAFYNAYESHHNTLTLLFSNKELENVMQKSSNTRIELAYILNKNTYLQIFGGFYTHLSDATIQNKYWSVGIRTRLSNHYYDF